MAQNLDTVLLGAVATVAGLGNTGLNLLVLFVLSYLFTADTQPGHRWLSRWTTPKRRPHVEVVFYVVAAMVESHVVAPILYGRAIGLRSAFVLLALVIGAKAEGVVGVFFAVPVAVIVAALAEELQSMVVPEHRPFAEAAPAALATSNDGGREGAGTEEGRPIP